MKKLTDRNKQIKRMRKQRYTLREIGEKFGITKVRVRQICLAKQFSTGQVVDLTKVKSIIKV